MFFPLLCLFFLHEIELRLGIHQITLSMLLLLFSLLVITLFCKSAKIQEASRQKGDSV